MSYFCSDIQHLKPYRYENKKLCYCVINVHTGSPRPRTNRTEKTLTQFGRQQHPDVNLQQLPIVEYNVGYLPLITPRQDIVQLIPVKIIYDCVEY